MFSKLDHFSIFEIEITLKSKNSEVIKSIENILNEHSVIIKHMSNLVKDSEMDSTEEEQRILKICGKYSNKDDENINSIISDLANLEGIIKVEEQ